jgi:hypothetical protein
MVSFRVMMKNVVEQCVAQRRLAEQDQFGQALLFYCAMPPLQMRV